MKRIQSACVEQTIHFKPKEEGPKEMVYQNMEGEVKTYLGLLERRKTNFRIVQKIPQEDGSILLKNKEAVQLLSLRRLFK